MGEKSGEAEEKELQMTGVKKGLLFLQAGRERTDNSKAEQITIKSLFDSVNMLDLEMLGFLGIIKNIEVRILIQRCKFRSPKKTKCNPSTCCHSAEAKAHNDELPHYL